MSKFALDCLCLYSDVSYKVHESRPTKLAKYVKMKVHSGEGSEYSLGRVQNCFVQSIWNIIQCRQLNEFVGGQVASLYDFCTVSQVS